MGYTTSQSAPCKGHIEGGITAVVFVQWTVSLANSVSHLCEGISSQYEPAPTECLKMLNTEHNSS